MRTGGIESTVADSLFCHILLPPQVQLVIHIIANISKIFTNFSISFSDLYLNRLDCIDCSIFGNGIILGNVVRLCQDC